MQLKTETAWVKSLPPCRPYNPVFSPGSRPRDSCRGPALIEDRLPLSGRFLLSDPARLADLLGRAGLSVVQIARQLGLSITGVVAALRRLGIAADVGRNGHARRGRSPSAVISKTAAS
jgi:hypothetical protein